MLEPNQESIDQINSSKPDLQNLKTYQKVKVACEYILNTGNHRSPDDNTLSSMDLFSKSKADFPEDFQDVSKNTFLQYLSNTVKDTESKINCLGKKQGYYLLENPPEQKIQDDAITEQEVEEIKSDKRERKQKERLLYPVLESWLIAQGYQAKDVSSGRSLGKWGNPDIAGLSALDTFNGLSIELLTIEAKTSLLDWEKWIFEAVSHRRFANRSYFAFAHPSETVSKIPQDMRYYAELYNIGVLALSIDNEKFNSLLNGELTEVLDMEDVDIIELYSAPYNFVQPKYQLKFCDALGITCIKELYQWGTDI